MLSQCPETNGARTSEDYQVGRCWLRVAADDSGVQNWQPVTRFHWFSSTKYPVLNPRLITGDRRLPKDTERRSHGRCAMTTSRCPHGNLIRPNVLRNHDLIRID